MKILIDPNEKTPKAPNSVDGASSGSCLQPLFRIIALELDNISALIRECL
jgi:hypothetical protein